jgi:zinc transporter 1
LATRKHWNAQFTYGYQRAEVVGALINGVFLLALCFTIVIEAIERFFNPVAIEKPWVVVVVGGVGLCVNLLGLVLFHGVFILCVDMFTL